MILIDKYDSNLTDIEVAFHNLRQSRVRFREFVAGVTIPSDPDIQRQRHALYTQWKEREKLFMTAVEKWNTNG